MAHVENGREFAVRVFGNDNSVPNFAKRIAASLYYEFFLHEGPNISPDILAGIERNLSKLLTKEDMKKLSVFGREERLNQ